MTGCTLANRYSVNISEILAATLFRVGKGSRFLRNVDSLSTSLYIVTSQITIMILFTSVRYSDPSTYADRTTDWCKYSRVALASAVTYSHAKQQRTQVHEERQVSVKDAAMD
jgi:hypothetical protein